MNISITSLVAEARKLFGTSRATRGLRHQWVSKTHELMTRGIHIKQTGKFPGKVQSRAEQPVEFSRSSGIYPTHLSIVRTSQNEGLRA